MWGGRVGNENGSGLEKVGNVKVAKVGGVTGANVMGAGVNATGAEIIFIIDLIMYKVIKI